MTWQQNLHDCLNFVSVLCIIQHCFIQYPKTYFITRYYSIINSSFQWYIFLIMNLNMQTICSVSSHYTLQKWHIKNSIHICVLICIKSLMKQLLQIKNYCILCVFTRLYLLSYINWVLFQMHYLSPRSCKDLNRKTFTEEINVKGQEL